MMHARTSTHARGVIMNQPLFENTKLAAYFLWERTACENTLNLWNCAEDIACYLEQNEILSSERIVDFLKYGRFDIRYIQFVRHISFRIYLYTGREDSLANWFAAESLLENGEWRSAIAAMALICNEGKNTINGLNELHSGQIKSFYDSLNAHQDY
jgi:hypothetical protein